MDLTSTVQRLAKADFLHGLGLAVGLHQVSFVHVAKRFLAVSLHHARTEPLPESGRERLEVLGQALTQFLHDIAVVPDQVVLCLSRQVAYVSRLMVPEAARESLDQVLDYEVERLVPLPKDDLYYDYLTYDIGGEEKRIGVVLFGLPRQLVDEYLEVLLRAQVRPQMVTLSSSALVSTLAFCGLPSEAPCVLVAPENGGVELNCIEKKRLVASQVFSLTEGSDKTAFEELLAQGIARNLPGSSPAETPIFVCSTNGVLPITVGDTHDLQALAAVRFALTGGDTLPAAALPALGASLQAVDEAPDGVNVLPEERRARREQRLSPLTLFLAVVVCVLGPVWALSVVVQEHRVLRTLAHQRATLDPVVRQVQAQEEEISQMQKRLQTLDGVTQRKLVPLLKGLSEVLPEDFYLNHFRYKDGDLDLSGLGSKPAADLIALLENAPCLKNVAPKAPFTKTPQGETFTLGAQVEPCE